MVSKETALDVHPDLCYKYQEIFRKLFEFYPAVYVVSGGSSRTVVTQ